MSIGEKVLRGVIFIGLFGLVIFGYLSAVRRRLQSIFRQSHTVIYRFEYPTDDPAARPADAEVSPAERAQIDNDPRLDVFKDYLDKLHQ